MDIIKLENISFAYDRALIFKNISLTIEKGEIIGIIGPNGAGKSTLIKLLGGALTPQKGTICVDGKPLRCFKKRELAKKIAFVPQGTFIPFSFTSGQVVLMGRNAHLSPFGFESERDIEIAKNVMRLTDTISFASRDINSLSGGERQRVILARALAQESEILLLDEPTTFLDIRHQIDLHKILIEENVKKGTTIISAMHDLNLASTFCNRVVIIKKGEVIADGSPKEVITTDKINMAFDADIRIITDEISGNPYCLPKSTQQ